MIDVFDRYHSSVPGVQPVPHELPFQYGIVDGKLEKHIKELAADIDKAIDYD